MLNSYWHNLQSKLRWLWSNRCYQISSNMIRHTLHITWSIAVTYSNNIHIYIYIYCIFDYLWKTLYQSISILSTYIYIILTCTYAVKFVITGVTPVKCSCSRHWVLQLEVHQGGHVVHTQAQDLLRILCIGAFQVRLMAITTWSDHLLHCESWFVDTGQNKYNCAEGSFFGTALRNVQLADFLMNLLHYTNLQF